MCIFSISLKIWSTTVWTMGLSVKYKTPHKKYEYLPLTAYYVNKDYRILLMYLICALHQETVFICTSLYGLHLTGKIGDEQGVGFTQINLVCYLHKPMCHHTEK